MTDPLQIIASPLEMVPTEKLISFLENYFQQEPVETIVIGEPLHRDNTPTAVAEKVYELRDRLKQLFPAKAVVLHDERFTSKEAARALVQAGVKKKKRQEKGTVDKVSAALILQDFMGWK